MKTVILCGGKGTRLREETEYKPKSMVLVGDKPILWHIMKFYSYFGFDDFILCLGYKGEMIRDYFLNYDEFEHDFTLKLGKNKKEISYHNKKTPDWNITFVNTDLECETGSRIAKIKKYLDGEENFFLTYGDGVSDVDINKLFAYHKEKNKTVTVTSVKPVNPFGIIEAETGLVKSFLEKPQSKDWVNGGFFVCNKKIFDYLSSDGNCIFEKEPLRCLVSKEELATYHHSGFWHCVDTLKDMTGLNYFYEQNHRPWMIWES